MSVERSRAISIIAFIASACAADVGGSNDLASGGKVDLGAERARNQPFADLIASEQEAFDVLAREVRRERDVDWFGRAIGWVGEHDNPLRRAAHDVALFMGAAVDQQRPPNRGEEPLYELADSHAERYLTNARLNATDYFCLEAAERLIAEGTPAGDALAAGRTCAFVAQINLARRLATLGLGLELVPALDIAEWSSTGDAWEPDTGVEGAEASLASDFPPGVDFRRPVEQTLASGAKLCEIAAAYQGLTRAGDGGASVDGCVAEQVELLRRTFVAPESFLPPVGGDDAR